VAAAPAAVRVLGGAVARMTPRPWALRGGRKRLSVRMSVATTESASAAAAVGAVSALSSFVPLDRVHPSS
jgi:glucose-1-phosphate adenylyltransferase